MPEMILQWLFGIVIVWIVVLFIWVAVQAGRDDEEGDKDV